MFVFVGMDVDDYGFLYLGVFEFELGWGMLFWMVV